MDWTSLWISPFTQESVPIPRLIFSTSTLSEKTGFEIETPVLGLQVGRREGVELHLFQLTFGVSFFPPALKIPFQSRLGFSLSGMPEPRPLEALRKEGKLRYAALP
jgi:hypothetical protein